MAYILILVFHNAYSTALLFNIAPLFHNASVFMIHLQELTLCLKHLVYAVVNHSSVLTESKTPQSMQACLNFSSFDTILKNFSLDVHDVNNPRGVLATYHIKIPPTWIPQRCDSKFGLMELRSSLDSPLIDTEAVTVVSCWYHSTVTDRDAICGSCYCAISR